MKLVNSFRRTRRAVTIKDRNRPPVDSLTLSFINDELNKAFEKNITRNSLSFVRLSLSLAIALYVVFAWLDRLVTPEVVNELMAIRVISCLTFVSVIYLTYTEWGVKNLQFLMSLMVVLAGLGIIGMILVSESIGGYLYYAGLILAIMYAHGLLRIRFVYASVTTWLVIITYITATVWMGVTPFRIYINNIFFLVSANIMGMFASYWLEYYMKAVFWNESTLHEKNVELETEYKRKSNELQAARRIQLNMLPKHLPLIKDFEFSFSMNAASEVGGDYYDYHVDDNSVLTFGVGDATGHGMQASVIVSAIKLLFSEHGGVTEIVDFLKRASRSISLMGVQKLYMAFAMGRLRGNILELAGAGMPPAMIYRAKTRQIEQIPLKGMPLGSKLEYPYKKVFVELNPGDVVLVLTDGFPELFNHHREMLGYARVAELFTKVVDRHPQEIIAYFYKMSEIWLEGQEQSDDITFFVFKRKALNAQTKKKKAMANRVTVDNLPV